MPETNRTTTPRSSPDDVAISQRQTARQAESQARPPTPESIGLEADTTRRLREPPPPTDLSPPFSQAMNRIPTATTRWLPDFDSMESNPEILRIQIRQADIERSEVLQRMNLGAASRADLQRAEARAELFRAKLDNSRARFARVKLTAAEQWLDEVTARFRAGLASGAEVQLAKDDVEIERARLRDAEARAPSSGASNQ